MPYLLGVDQGTTQTRAVILDETGRLVAQHSAALPARFPQPGWVEQDPWVIVRTVKEAAGPLIERYASAALGFDNQGETFLLWDAAHAPTSPKVDGGLAGNPYLMQAIADLLNLEGRVAAAREATAIGVAQLARPSACRWPTSPRAGRPRPSNVRG
jgi:glycerol kinase